VSNLNLAVLYKCEDEYCSLNEEDDDGSLGYSLILNYTGYKLDHQGPIPLYLSEEGYCIGGFSFFFKKPMSQYFRWGIMRYYQEKAFLGVINELFGEDDNTLIGGYFTGHYYYFLNGIIDENLAYLYIEGNWYKLLGINYAVVDLLKFEEYKRTKRSIMDVFADISALSMTIFKIIAFVFPIFTQEILIIIK